MSKLDELIKELCPDGVEYKKLSEIFSTRNGYTPSKSNISYWENGTVPWFRMEDIRENGHILAKALQHVSSSAVKGDLFPADSIIVATSATIGEHALITVPSLANQRFTYLLLKTEWKYRLDVKFLFYYCYKLDNWCLNHLKQGNFASVDMKKFADFRFPIPPLEVQREIVNILDNFTELTTELTDKLSEELTARKKQYEYYRNRILTFDSKDISIFKLQDVVEIQRGIRVTRNQLSNDGKYPVYQNSLVPMGYYNDKNREADSAFLICAGAAGDIGYSTQPFWAADDCYTFECSDKILNRYLFYVLKNKQSLIYSKVRRASVPRISRESIGTIKIPVPAIQVQKRIINVLDNFDKVCNDLHIGLPAEIEARKKQYEFYRDSLLTFLEKGESILTEQNRTELRYALIKLLQYVFGFVWIPLGSISENLDSYRKPIKQGNRVKGIYPYYGASGIVDYVKDYIFDGNFLLVSEDGANLTARVTPIAFSITGKNWVNNHAHVLKFHDLDMQKYVEFYLNFLNLQFVISGAAQPKLTKNNLDKIKIPVPDENVLKKIVSILERFDTLCHDISSGLPAEIEARQKQYEYYRDKLLDFKEKKG